MAFVSILGKSPYGLRASELAYPSFIKDLNIDRITETILAKWEGFSLEKYFRYPAADKETLLYRREVFRDLKDPALREVMRVFSGKMRTAKGYLEHRAELERLMEYPVMRSTVTALSNETAMEMKHQHMLYDAAAEYIGAAEYLLSELESFSPKSRGLLDMREYLVGYCESSEYRKLKAEYEKLTEGFGSLEFQFEVFQNRLTLTDEYETFDAAEEIRRRCGFAGEKNDGEAGFKSPFGGILRINEFEGLLLSMLQKPCREIFAQTKAFSEEFGDFMDDVLERFEEEVLVYLAMHDFYEQMGEYGFAFTEAEISEEAFLLQDNYDVALACKHCFHPERIVVNACAMQGGERFFVVTGPNQGGKTTFARAVGQAVYFHQMGFPVAGTKAALPVCPELLTHFPEEESLASGAGKLKEELLRLKPMLPDRKQNGFIIFNELFTTATSYDAKLMGKNIIKRFLASGYRGIYVTHMKELSVCDEAVVSLVAQVEKEDEAKRTFRIKRDQAQGIAYAQTIAQKYRLSAGEITQRVRERSDRREK